MRGGEWRWSTRVDENERGEGFKAKYGVEVTRVGSCGLGGGRARARVGASCFSGGWLLQWSSESCDAI